MGGKKKKSTMTVKKFEKLVKSKKDDYAIMRAYWEYGEKGGFMDLQDDVLKIEKLIWKHRRKAWHFINYQWDHFTPNIRSFISDDGA